MRGQCAGVLFFVVMVASSPAAAQFMCTTTATDSTCTNSGNAGAFFPNIAPQAGQNANANATTTNSGTAVGFTSLTSGGGNATATNSGSNTGAAFIAQTGAGGGSAVATNSGSNVGGFLAQTAFGNATAVNTGNDTGVGHAFADVIAVTLVSGNATASNSGTIGDANAGNFSFLEARTQIAGNATATNSGSSAGGVVAEVLGTGIASASNSGTTAGNVAAETMGGGDATATNSGSAAGVAAATFGGGNATAINSGSAGGLAAATFAGGNATVINSGTNNGGIAVAAFGGGSATLTNIVGGRVIGHIALRSKDNIVNFQGGNWLFTIMTQSGPTTINTGGAPFVVAGSFGSMSGAQVAVLDPTAFALADRSLTNFTGEISEMLRGRFAGMSAGAGGPGALGFAGAPSSPVADQAQVAFSGIPSVAMSYASGGSRPVLGKAPAVAPYYDATIWASGFGGERKQRADGVVLPTTDTAFGGAMGVDRVLGGNLRLGVFVGAGASREAVELDVQKIDATYVFGGAYGRFDWISQYLDFSLYGGGIDNKSTRQIANNTAASGIETATASYGGWFISPEVIYGYRIPFSAITVTPRVRLRYVGGQLDGYSESGSMQNLSVGRRSINDLEERGEVELSTVAGAFKGSVTVGIIGLERLGNPNINTVLLGQNLAFVTPGQASAFGGVFGMHMEYRAMPNVSLFVAGEATAMSDKSDSFAASGGGRVSF